MTFKVPEHFRIVANSALATTARDGNNGAFILKLNHGQTLKAIASDGGGWEHVSVSRHDRCPTWDEVCQVKDLFWGAEDVVVQFHPRRSEYVNNHKFSLHLWRKIGHEFETPPSYMVGVLL